MRREVGDKRNELHIFVGACPGWLQVRGGLGPGEVAPLGWASLSRRLTPISPHSDPPIDIQLSCSSAHPLLSFIPWGGFFFFCVWAETFLPFQRRDKAAAQVGGWREGGGGVAGLRPVKLL